MMAETAVEDALEGIAEPIKVKLIELKNQLDKVEAVVQKADSLSITELHENLTPLEIAKFNWISIYALNSLYFVYLKNSGAALKDHPLMPELLRIKNYMTKISEISEAEKNKNPLKLDKDSSARIIKRSLWQNAQKKSKPSEAEAAEFDGKPKAPVKRELCDSADVKEEPQVKKRSL